jgi:hypothetical protein
MLPVAPATQPTGAPTDAFLSAPDGTFRIDGVPPGRFTAHAAHADFADGSADGVKAGGDVTITLRHGATIVGRVTDEHDAPVLGADVSIHAGTRTITVAISDEDGHYRLEHIAGTYQLRGWARGFGEVEIPVDAGPALEGHTIEQDVVLRVAGEVIAGRVTDSERRPIAKVEVTAKGGAHATTDGDGRFRLDGLAEGTYVLELKHPAYPTQHATAKAGDDDVAVTMAAGGGVRASVRDAFSSVPIAAFTVRAVGPDGKELSKPFTKGALELVPLAPGRWRLTIEARDFATRTVTVDVPAAREAGEPSVTDLEIELHEGATVGGTVYDEHGETVAGATVECGGVRGATDRYGTFKLVGVEPGDVPVKATFQGATGQKIVPLRSGDEVTTIEIKLGE